MQFRIFARSGTFSKSQSHVVMVWFIVFHFCKYCLLSSQALLTHVQRGLRYLVCKSVCLSVCLFVCLSVTTFSVTARNETTTQLYRWIHRYTGFILKMAISVTTAFKSYGMKSHYLDRFRSLRVYLRHRKSQRRACLDSRMLFTPVASPCQTLR